VAVLVVTALAAMLAMSLLFQMRAEVAASGALHAREQAYAAAMSGVERAITVLQSSAGNVDAWYDNPDLFLNQLVCTDSRGDSWYFTLYAPNPADPCAVRNGIMDEASKININTASAATLAKLPNMTPELVDCLMDYRDADDEPRPEGAEQDYYSHLASPYLIKNGMLGTLEELLLVKGFNGSIVYGEDYNLNGVLDKNEDDGDDTFPPDNRDGQLDTGLMGVATTVSYERNVDSSGKARVNLNGTDVAALGAAGLGATTVQFIEAYRADGNFFRHPGELLGMTYTSKTLKDRNGNPQKLSSGVTADNLAKVLDKLTTSPTGARAPLMGLVNVNTASKAVLSMLPGMDENLAEQIAGARDAVEADKKTSIAWLVSQNVLEPAKFKEVAPYLTARSFQFRVRCVGFGYPSGRFCALEAVVDLAQGTPRTLYLRDLTHLGMPLPVQPDQLGGMVAGNR
jgi:DNA uptake protein ComE-like DNA-binding protein